MSLVRLLLGPEPDMSSQQRKDKYFGAHEFQAREEVVKTSSDRGFGLMFGVVFGLIAGYGAYRGSTLWPYWLAASGALATVALSVPRVLALPNRLWTKVGLVLFKVVSPVVLALVFYVTVTPINLLLRLLGKDILGLGWKRDDSTYWIARNPPGPAPDTLKNQF